MILLILLILFGVVIAAVAVGWCLLYYHHNKGMFGIPTPRLWLPIVGNLFELSNPIDTYWDLHRIAVNVGKFKAVRGSGGNIFGIYIAEPEFLETVMTHSTAINKSFLYRFLHPWLGTGLLTSSGEKWRHRRKLLTPAYHFKILEQFIDVFDKNSDIAVQKIQMEVGKPRTDIFPFISLCALDSICESAMGTKVNAQINADSEFVYATKTMAELPVRRCTSILKQFDITYQFCADYGRGKKCLKTLHDYTISVIEQRRKELKNQQVLEALNPKKEKDVDGVKKKVPFLDLLLQQPTMTNDDIREEVDTFMFGGHDTVAAGMSFTLYCISQSPQVQTKIIEEQQTIYGKTPNRETVIPDLHAMKYLEMVIKEAMRLYPPVPLMGRQLTDNLQYKEHTMTKGTQLAIGVYTVHRNPAIYPDPERFDPDRFLPENQTGRHPYAYIPFSAGHRNCVGQKFAMLEMKAIVSKLLRNFVFLEAPDNALRLRSDLVISSTTGVNVRIEKRVW